MSSIVPKLQIHQQLGLLGIQTTQREPTIKQPEATLELEQIQPKADCKKGSSRLNIDQSDAWDALMLGGHSRRLAVSIRSLSRWFLKVSSAEWPMDSELWIHSIIIPMGLLLMQKHIDLTLTLFKLRGQPPV
ncbi:DUF6470 family protein [Paenibacillus hexagrammi]|uniref:DUF6470 family protein n=1 Tax=Paenibacillus hexagrammi TaxID=2908839 RepID=A0ABY3SH84_9BACL|nr:DUF6470 family protein [Paenibacillus sp. YPD9-1]UJF33227.1 DUF6470 family protein [Paenibacillus sp. YPD9-1]